MTQNMRDLLATGAPLFPVSDSMFGAPSDGNDRFLLMTYLDRGKRGAVHIRNYDEFTVSFLADTAEAGLQAGEYVSSDLFMEDADEPVGRGLREGS